MQGNLKFIYDVQFILSLAYNFLNVAHLMINDYSVLFDNDSYIDSDKKYGQTIAVVPMTHNNMFPLNALDIVKNT